jgi:hypothetical protein
LKEERREGARARRLKANKFTEGGKMQRGVNSKGEKRRADCKQTRSVEKGVANMVLVVPKAQTLRQALVI